MAVASLASGGGPPGVIFTAIATPIRRLRTRSWWAASGNRFEPAELTIDVGDTVNWFWPKGSEGHNVVPDDGDSPPQSGPLVGYPKFTATGSQVPGVYRYHCIAHGAAGGVGMSGTITVWSRLAERSC